MKVKVATTHAVDLEGLQSINGLLLEPDDTVLVLHNAPIENGVYVVKRDRWLRVQVGTDEVEAERGFADFNERWWCAAGIWVRVQDPIPSIATQALADIESFITNVTDFHRNGEPGSHFPEYVWSDGLAQALAGIDLLKKALS